MNTTNTIALAFPHSRLGSDNDGMALRDYFAAKAMQSFLVADGTTSFDIRAKESYEMADAMLKARQA